MAAEPICLLHSLAYRQVCVFQNPFYWIKILLVRQQQGLVIVCITDLKEAGYIGTWTLLSSSELSLFYFLFPCTVELKACGASNRRDVNFDPASKKIRHLCENLTCAHTVVQLRVPANQDFNNPARNYKCSFHVSFSSLCRLAHVSNCGLFSNGPWLGAISMMSEVEWPWWV